LEEGTTNMEILENQPQASLPVINEILSVLLAKYGGLSCAPNLANDFPSISNDEMFGILESLVERGVLTHVSDPELCRKMRYPTQTVYRIR
jgi:hypothetical protein